MHYMTGGSMQARRNNVFKTLKSGNARRGTRFSVQSGFSSYTARSMRLDRYTRSPGLGHIGGDTTDAGKIRKLYIYTYMTGRSPEVSLLVSLIPKNIEVAKTTNILKKLRQRTTNRSRWHQAQSPLCSWAARLSMAT